jgi:AcrR family transcriptional regulator
MAQRPKEEVRVAILAAAAEELAEGGFERATLATIASRAGTSVGNLYKYFANKDELFAQAIPEGLELELRALLRIRVEALAAERDVGALSEAHPYRAVSAELLRFALAHRAELLFLLRRAHGTRYAAVSEEIARDLAKLAEGYARRAYPEIVMTAAVRRALLRIYRAFIASIASILDEETRERALRDATDRLVTYHLAGLRAFFVAEEQTKKEGKNV